MHSIEKGPTGPCQNLRTSKLFKSFLGMRERMSEGKRERECVSVCVCVVRTGTYTFTHGWNMSNSQVSTYHR